MSTPRSWHQGAVQPLQGNEQGAAPIRTGIAASCGMNCSPAVHRQEEAPQHCRGPPPSLFVLVDGYSSDVNSPTILFNLLSRAFVLALLSSRCDRPPRRLPSRLPGPCWAVISTVTGPLLQSSRWTRSPSRLRSTGPRARCRICVVPVDVTDAPPAAALATE